MIYFLSIIIVLIIIYLGNKYRIYLKPKDTIYIKNISKNLIKYNGIVLYPGEDVTVQVLDRVNGRSMIQKTKQE
jgi:hypothetical protein